MAVQRLTKDEDVVEVHDNTFANERPEGLIHDSHECARCVRKTEWHD